MHTTTDIAKATGRKMRQVQIVCRQLFGPGPWRRMLSEDQYNRVLRAFQQPGRRKNAPNSLPDDAAPLN